jgi:hypothetical protein
MSGQHSAAKARLQSTASALKQRLSPSNLAHQARDKVRETTSAVAARATDAVKSRPTTTKAVAGVAALFLFRKTLGRIGRAMWGRDARQRRAVRRTEKRAQKEAERTGSQLPPNQLVPPPPEAPRPAASS